MNDTNNQLIKNNLLIDAPLFIIIYIALILNNFSEFQQNRFVIIEWYFFI
jgi:hypothetical protein